LEESYLLLQKAAFGPFCSLPEMGQAKGVTFAHY